jgi:hypothetical protein
MGNHFPAFGQQWTTLIFHLNILIRERTQNLKMQNEHMQGPG